MSGPLFDAAGYAKWRPAVHPHVMERICARLRRRVGCALDVGCGSGLSTRPLERLADRFIGIDPEQAMLRLARKTVPDAHFVAGRAEELPLRSQSIDAITAAGSMNYTDLDRSLAEAARVLTRDGVLVIYDFSQGRWFRGSGALDGWFSSFVSRYPRPGEEEVEINPQLLSKMESGFQVRKHEDFEIALTVSPEFYIEYVLTETNVAHAVRNGVSREEIRAWCGESLRGVFQGRDREVLFRGYIAYLFPV